jgi:hypothetical protein
VYNPLAVMVPAVGLPVEEPSTVQVTPVFDVFWTVGVNCCVPPGDKSAEVGLRLTEIGGGAVTVTPALANALVLATLVAVTVCGPAVAGAVYVAVAPLVVIVPTVLLPLR